MATFAELQARVLVAVIDAPTAIIAAVPGFVNRAITKLQQGHNFKTMERVAAFTTVLSTRSIGAMPSDFKAFNGKPWRVSDSGSVLPLVWGSSHYGTLLGINEESEGPPRSLLDSDDPTGTGARNWHVYPLPDGNSDYSDGEYRIKVPYFGYLTALSGSTDTNWFTVNAEDFIVDWAVAQAFAIDWDEQRMAVWLQKMDNERKDVVRVDKQYRLSGGDTLVPLHQGVYQPRSEE